MATVTSKHTAAEIRLYLGSTPDSKLGKDINRSQLPGAVASVCTMMGILWAIQSPTDVQAGRRAAVPTPHNGVTVVEHPGTYNSTRQTEYEHRCLVKNYENYNSTIANFNHNIRCLKQALRGILTDEHIMKLPNWARSEWSTTDMHTIWEDICTNLLRLTAVECDNLSLELQSPWNSRACTIQQHLYKFQQGVLQLEHNENRLPPRYYYLWLKNSLLHLQQFKGLFAILENANVSAVPVVENTYEGLIKKILGVLASDAQFILNSDHNYARRAEDDLEQASKASSRSPPTSSSPTSSIADLMTLMKAVLKRVDQPAAKNKKVEFKFNCAHHGSCYHKTEDCRVLNSGK
jgi:hypothetical protein